MKLQNEIIIDQTLALFDSEVNVLGPNLTLKNCTIISQSSAKALSFNGLSIIGGEFQSKVPLNDFQWCKVNLKHVKFTGSYSGCDFGMWPEYHGQYGGISNCDFSSANVENCRFFNCEIKTLKLPQWPHFTIPNPSNQKELIHSIEWPGKLSLIMNIYAKSPDECSAITGNADTLIKKLGGDNELFRDLLSQIKGVIF